ncbi:hypothetical protein [Streptomyces lonarensis]|uniref:Uncharacterized protein n=1 Tax=Streptomyces lonarensis TaxID=700599 RepID=A0A7X6CYX5_9ACTN|nr:hypothetical protein [Streptomyces lonarensis]NJQ05112.1 hypothetical protein [Streptomyces lonarensis]
MREQQRGDERRHGPPRQGAARAGVPPRAEQDAATGGLLRLQGLAGNSAVSRLVAEQGVVPSTAGRGLTPVGRPAAASGGTAAVQRTEYDELHRHPAGPSLRVRGPRPSRKQDRTRNELREDEWQQLPAQVRGASHKQRLTVDQDPQTLQEADPALHYSLGSVRRLAPDIPDTAGRNAVLEGMGRADGATRGYWSGQDARDRRLGRDARAARHSYTETPEERRQRHDTVDSALRSPESSDAMDDLRSLLARFEGVAIGGGHSGSQTWQFLHAHMAELRAAGVQTLYLESVRDDSYQADVDSYLAGQEMSPGLLAFVTRYDSSMGLGTTGLRAVLEAARTHGVRVRGLDGRPARRPPMPANDLFARVAGMNTYAAQVVSHDRRRSSAVAEERYLMELGSRHTGMYTDQPKDASLHGTPFEDGAGFPGVDDLLRIPAVSYEDDRFRRLAHPS